jgi:hypothetical protein
LRPLRDFPRQDRALGDGPRQGMRALSRERRGQKSHAPLPAPFSTDKHDTAGHGVAWTLVAERSKDATRACVGIGAGVTPFKLPPLGTRRVSV